MLGKHKFRVGQRVQLSNEGRNACIIPKCRRDTRGTVTKVGEFNDPWVRWDHRRTASGYSPYFIEPVAKRR